MQGFTFIDLFCGCGGFTLGMERAGFKCLAALDFNPEAISVLRQNFPKVPYVLQKDVTEFGPEALEALAGANRVDVIVGGPPCQGFSAARQVDGANHGARLIADSRRYLYQEFLKYVDHFKPKVFVMENVLGIRTASGGEYFARVQKEARLLGYRVHSQVEDCVKLGLPQKRRRQLFIGTRLDLPEYFRSELKTPPRAPVSTTLWQAIGDLPRLRAGEGIESTDYDLALRNKHLQEFGGGYLFGVLEIGRAKKLTAHRARPHSDRDLRDFKLLKEGENSKEAMERGVQFEFPYKKHHFKDRYTRQSRWEPCSTIVAHLSKDGLMFVHPTQHRSLTPREAARVQSFPDWFQFPIARTHQFRVIGNAVPPLIGEAIGLEVNDYIRRTMCTKRPKFTLSPLPRNEREAAKWVLSVACLDKKQMRAAESNEFKRAWFSVAFLYAGLHPDSALDHGSQISNDAEDYPTVTSIEQRLVNPYFDRSGWPVLLAPLAKEAWRRYESGELTDDEFYCSEAQMAGICHRSPSLAADVERERRVFAN